MDDHIDKHFTYSEKGYTLTFKKTHCLSFVTNILRRVVKRNLNVWFISFECKRALTPECDKFLQQIVATSKTLWAITFYAGTYTVGTMIAVSRGLRVNKKLEYLFFNTTPSIFHLESVLKDFVQTLRVGPKRPPRTMWGFGFKESYESLLERANQ